MTANNQFKLGDRVKLRAEFLRNTGQYTGEEPFKRWTVQACACKSCELGLLIAVDEPHYEIEGRLRHVAVSNVCPADKVELA